MPLIGGWRGCNFYVHSLPAARGTALLGVSFPSLTYSAALLNFAGAFWARSCQKPIFPPPKTRNFLQYKLSLSRIILSVFSLLFPLGLLCWDKQGRRNQLRDSEVPSFILRKWWSRGFLPWQDTAGHPPLGRPLFLRMESVLVVVSVGGEGSLAHRHGGPHREGPHPIQVAVCR